MDSPLLHIANILYLASYSVRDMLWLRCLTVLAMLCLSYCYIACDAWQAVYWQLAFLAINIVQIVFLLLERRPVKLTPVQQQLIDGPLLSLSPRQVQRFAEKAVWRDYQQGERILEENTRLNHLVLIFTGEATVTASGREIARLNDGQFAGEMSFLTGGNSTAEVTAVGEVQCAQWSREYVTDMLARDRELGTAIQAALGTDLVKKLLRTRG